MAWLNWKWINNKGCPLPGKTKSQVPAIDPANLPRHIAVIMDGNGRWATARRLPRTAGHRAGMSALKELVNACGELGIPVLTVFAFSTENWKRPAEEVNFLMDLLVEYINRELDELNSKGVKIRLLGEMETLPARVQEEIRRAIETTSKNKKLILNVALNYGGRREIILAAQKIGQKIREGTLEPENIDEELFNNFLYTDRLPDPDLVIRPSGEMRISNFLLWQIAYAELWFSKVLWPDFKKEHLLEAIAEYQKRHRRFGGL